MSTTPQDDTRRWANRIRDAYTLDEAEQILNNLLDEYYAPIKMPDSNREKLIKAIKHWAITKGEARMDTTINEYVRIEKQEYINMMIELQNLKYKVEVLQEGIEKAMEISNGN